jgi:hypothetical protein
MADFDLSGLKHISRKDPVEPMGDAVPGVCKCGARWSGGNFCHCPTCHLTFRSVSGFDQHRDRRGEGECRSTDELRKRGFEPDADGIWRRPRPDDSIPGRTSTDG